MKPEVAAVDPLRRVPRVADARGSRTQIHHAADIDRHRANLTDPLKADPEHKAVTSAVYAAR